MSIRTFLLLPGLIRASARLPHRARGGWEQFWSGVRRTGPGGDVLGDAAERAELDWCVQRAARHFDPALPVVDAGCGNGRFSRLLAGRFPAVIGIGVAPGAVRLAEAESGGQPRVSYRIVDAGDRAAMGRPAGAAGAVNVFVRGVLHVTAPGKRAGIAAGIAALVGDAGRVLLVETAFDGHAGRSDAAPPPGRRTVITPGAAVLAGGCGTGRPRQPPRAGRRRRRSRRQ